MEMLDRNSAYLGRAHMNTLQAKRAFEADD